MKASQAAPPSLTLDLLGLHREVRRAWLVQQSEKDLAAVFGAAARDLGTPFGIFADDPVGFIELVLRSRLWSLQRAVAESVEGNRRTAVPSCHGIGKALRNGTSVLTPSGWCAIETLRAGDVVIAGDGSPTVVTGVYPQGVRPLWRITFNDGSSVDVDGGHLWTHRVGHERQRAGAWSVATTDDLVHRHGRRPIGWGRAEIPTVGPVAFPARPVPLDPYLVGALLGNAYMFKSTPVFSTGDAPESLALIGFPDVRPTKSRPLDYPLLGIVDRCREAGITGTHSWDKVVPDLYLWNSAEVRLAVLQGLMDTDGSPAKSGGAEFCSTSPKLAEQVVFLVRSLGGRATLSGPRVTTFGARGAAAEDKRAGRPSWRVRVVMASCPFRLTRKAKAWEEEAAKRTVTRARLIRSIEPIDPGPATCIAVDHPSALFVTKDFIVTHNTHLAGRIVAWWVSVHRPGTATVVTTASRFRQVKLQLWPHIRRVVADCGLPGQVDQVQWKVDGYVKAWGFSPGDYDDTAFSGIHDEHVLGVVDEAGGISPVLGQGLESLMSGGHSRLLLIGNPPVDEETASPWFEERCNSDLYHTIRIPASSTPHFTGEAIPPGASLVDPQWVADQVAEHGEDSRWVQARVHARFPKGGADKVVPAGWVEDARTNEDHLIGTRVRLGVDIASDGGDEFAIARGEGFVGRIVHHSSGEANENAVDVAGVVLREIKVAEARARELGSEEPVRVKVDTIGLGWGVVSLLKTWRLEGLHNGVIVPVNVGESARDAEKFANQRAEAWWTVRQALQPRPGAGGSYRGAEWRLDIDNRAAAQLSRPTKGTDSRGRIRIQKKDEIKRRGMGSPDRAEALMLMVYEPPGSDPAPTTTPEGIPQANAWAQEQDAFDSLGSGWNP